MLNINFIRENKELVIERLAIKNYAPAKENTLRLSITSDTKQCTPSHIKHHDVTTSHITPSQTPTVN